MRSEWDFLAAGLPAGVTAGMAFNRSLPDQGRHKMAHPISEDPRPRGPSPMVRCVQRCRQVAAKNHTRMLALALVVACATACSATKDTRHLDDDDSGPTGRAPPYCSGQLNVSDRLAPLALAMSGGSGSQTNVPATASLVRVVMVVVHDPLFRPVP